MAFQFLDVQKGIFVQDLIEQMSSQRMNSSDRGYFILQ